MKRILCLIDSLASGGAQRQMSVLAPLLNEKGFKVKVVTYYDFQFYLPELQNAGVDYECVSCGQGLVARLCKIGRAIKCFDPDVVISYLDTPNILACLLHISNRSRWTLIVSERNTTQKNSLGERIKFMLYRFADYIVPNSYSQRDFLNKNYPHYSDKCHVITNCVDTESFIPNKPITSSDELRIMGVGRVLKQKNIPMLINAVQNVREQGEKIHVDWYGSFFDTYEECQQLIRQFKLENIFEFHEPCQDIIKQYQSSSLFVLPSIFEGFPNVLCEAMSCGLPVIATDICDNRRIVQHNENGFLVPSGDTKQLAERILQFMNMPLEKREEMGGKSRDIAVELFSRESFVKQYIRLFD